MNRKEFLGQLEAQLSQIPPEERADAMAWYNEYFDEAGPENEAKVIAELGSPVRVAARIKADAAVRGLGEAGTEPGPRPRARKGIGVFWTVVLVILALPVALPIFLGLFSLFLGIVVTLLAVIVSLVVAVAAAFLCGLVALAGGVSALFVHVPTGVFYLGAGFVAIGVSLLLALLAILLSRALAAGVTGLFGLMRRGGKAAFRRGVNGGGAYE
ncbi:MAG: DUF1700 domain-containing protein [Clostridiales Family XIII bacterium]|nr:DUF1700 domain-containing protein [Clostridiales Family XIII bacterium]